MKESERGRGVKERGMSESRGQAQNQTWTALPPSPQAALLGGGAAPVAGDVCFQRGNWSNHEKHAEHPSSCHVKIPARAPQTRGSRSHTSVEVLLTLLQFGRGVDCDIKSKESSIQFSPFSGVE